MVSICNPLNCGPISFHCTTLLFIAQCRGSFKIDLSSKSLCHKTNAMREVLSPVDSDLMLSRSRVKENTNSPSTSSNRKGRERRKGEREGKKQKYKRKKQTEAMVYNPTQLEI